jgi:hypothetical protein
VIRGSSMRCDVMMFINFAPVDVWVQQMNFNANEIFRISVKASDV